MRRLIGPADWDPFGESLWCICHKVAARNNLNWVELRRFLGSYGLASFTDQRRCGKKADPDIPENFALPSLARLHGWDTDVFDASFSDFYCADWFPRQEGRQPRNARPLKVCWACMKEGVHLGVHQLQLFARCPLHDERLRTDCAHCGSSLDAYRMADPARAFKCGECEDDWWQGGAAPSAESVFARRRMIREYTEWLRRAGAHGLFGVPALSGMDDLVFVEQIVPGPPWLRQSMARGPGACVIDAVSVDGALECPVEGQWAQRERLDDPLWFVTGRPAATAGVVQAFPIVDEELPELLSDLRRSFRVSAHARHSVWVSSGRSCQVSWGEGMSAWDAAWWLLRSHYDSSFKYMDRWWPRLTASMGYQSVLSWEFGKGPGSLLWSAGPGVEVPANERFVEAIRKRWLRKHLEGRFLSLASLIIRACGDGDWLDFTALDSAFALDDLPRCLVRASEVSTEYFMVSKIAPVEQFRSLCTKSFVGNDERFFSNYERLLPLVALYHLREDVAVSWRERWEEARMSTIRLEPAIRPQQLPLELPRQPSLASLMGRSS